MRRALAALLASCLLGPACGSAREIRIRETLATDCEAVGWRPTTGVRVYQGDTLFDYFGSEADVYREYGCRQVQVQDYRSVVGDEVRVEMFETRAPAGAYGLFSLKTRPGGELVNVGTQGWLEKLTLNFWRGRHEVKLQAREARGTAVEGLDHLAIAIDQGLSGEGELPRILELLPHQDLLPKGRVYVAGGASLAQALWQDRWPFPSPLRGALGSYAGAGGAHQILVLEYEDAAAAEQAGKAVAPAGMTLNEGRSRMILVAPYDHYLYSFIGPPGADWGPKALAGAAAKLRRFLGQR